MGSIAVSTVLQNVSNCIHSSQRNQCISKRYIHAKSNDVDRRTHGSGNVYSCEGIRDKEGDVVVEGTCFMTLCLEIRTSRQRASEREG